MQGWLEGTCTSVEIVHLCSVGDPTLVSVSRGRLGCFALETALC